MSVDGRATVIPSNPVAGEAVDMLWSPATTRCSGVLVVFLGILRSPHLPLAALTAKQLDVLWGTPGASCDTTSSTTGSSTIEKTP